VAKRFGMTAAPFDAWLACRGIRTPTWLERSQSNARALAEGLRADRRVRAVHYPGWGAMLSFDVGDLATASRVVAALSLVTLTPSLGGTTTTVSHSATSSHRAMSAEERRALGIGDGLLRLSAGLEAVEDIRADIDAALGSGTHVCRGDDLNLSRHDGRTPSTSARPAHASRARTRSDGSVASVSRTPSVSGVAFAAEQTRGGGADGGGIVRRCGDRGFGMRHAGTRSSAVSAASRTSAPESAARRRSVRAESADE